MRTQHKYCDCGAQSVYFATGGFQTFTGKPEGHFWAEAFLPDYGWIPVTPRRRRWPTTCRR